ncbi:hypothetical protein [uncultured Mediterranean phage uvMED]|nr:hypothetical protein [uncultured Mediterranean phage uvMED]
MVIHSWNTTENDMDYMTYYESASDTEITYLRAMKELDDHGIPESEKELFLKEFGRKQTYQAQDVLSWLGY